MTTYNTLLTFYILSVAISFGVLGVAIYTRQAPKSLYFTYLALGIFIYNFNFLFKSMTLSWSTALTAHVLQECAILMIGVVFLLFIMDYCGIKIKRSLVIVVFLLPAFLSMLILTYPLNGIFFHHVNFMADSVFAYLKVEGSVFYYIANIYSILVINIGVVILLYQFWTRDRLFKKQAVVILIAILIMGMIPFVSRFPFHINGLLLDLSPILASINILLIGVFQIRSGNYSITVVRNQIIEAIGDGFIILDVHGRFLDANDMARRIFPQLRTAVVGMKLEEREETAWMLLESVATGKDKYIIRESDGVKRHYQISPIEIMSGKKTISYCMMISDVTNARNRLDKVSRIAQRDPLTGLFNRRMLYLYGKRVFKKVTGSGKGACMMMLDLDFFKKVNDTYGHIKGDEVLKVVSGVLTSRFRNTDLLARYGGEEFCAFLPDISEEAALDIAETIRERIGKLKFLKEDSKDSKDSEDSKDSKDSKKADSFFQVTISIGLAVYDVKHHMTLDDLLSDADAALYAAKNSGRNTIYIARVSGRKNRVSSGQVVIECALKREKP
ncbi:MAG: diguanylate cyclase [Peptococcaceae bacterium]|nr:diguanylate cyclase [Peptococcaceae bacterium]